MLRNLRRTRAVRAGCAVDKHLLAALDLRLAQKMQCHEASIGNGGGFVMTQIRRRRREEFEGCRQADALGVTAHAQRRERPHAVAHVKARGFASNAFDLSGQDCAQDRTTWLRETDHYPCHQAHGEACGGNRAPDVAIARRDRRRADPDQDVVGSGNRVVDVLELQNFGRSIARADCRLHCRVATVDRDALYRSTRSCSGSSRSLWSVSHSAKSDWTTPERFSVSSTPFRFRIVR